MANVTDCDREPIHIPGTIQRFGVLFVLAEPSLTITQASDNVGDHLPFGVDEVLGRPLSAMMDPASVAQVSEALRDERWQDMNPLQIGVDGRRFDGIVHRHDGAAILELEPDAAPATGMHHPFRSALLRIQRVVTSAELADVVVQQMRAVTGFERVLFYRFHDDGHGSVDAEAKELALEPYLGLHYPASDIPAQARALYCKNWLRLIFDASAKPARVVPTLRADGRPLDLSFSVLRSVSPIHLQYMANMGVRASMSISIIVHGRLWGLISCLNHSSPRRVSHDMRMACEFLGRLASLHIAALEDADRLAGRASRRATEDELARAMRDSPPEGNVLEALFTRPKELMGIVGADGVAVVGGGDIVTSGRTPPPSLIHDVAAWVDGKDASGVFATASLGGEFPAAREAGDVASGLLTFALPGGAPQRRVLWFRPEFIQTVNWGGDPNKPVAADSGGRLRPRHSFALWRQEVKLRSRPWTESSLEAADELRRRAVEVDIARRFSSEQHAVRVRNDLLAVVSHDLRSPLAAVLLQTEVMMLQLTRHGDDERAGVLRGSAERIRRSATHMKALTDDLLDLASIEAHRFALRLESVDSRELVQDAVLAAAALAEAKRINLGVELIDGPRLEADPERMFRVLSNLLGNAIKFTPEGGTVTVRAERRGDDLSIAVADTGPGIAADQLAHVFERYWKAQGTGQSGAGLGLYIASGIVEAHGGKIWAESSAGHGATFTFILPLAR